MNENLLPYYMPEYFSPSPYVKIHEDVLASPVFCTENVLLPGGGLLLLHGVGQVHHCTALHC